MKCTAVLLVTAFIFGCAYAEEHFDEKSEAQARLLLRRKTFTSIRVSTTTTTVPFSCNVTPNPAMECRRRRRRRSPVTSNAVPLAAPEESAPQLAASQGAVRPDATADASGRRFFTVWTTSFSTFTTTSSVTDFLTTVSYSLACTATGMSLLPGCGAMMMGYT